MSNTTLNEVRVLRAVLTNKLAPQAGVIPASCPQEGISAESRVVNVASEPSGLTGAAYSGVCASLKRKGLLVVTGKGTKSNPYVLHVTPSGFEVAVAAGPTPGVTVNLPSKVIVDAAMAKASEAKAAAPETSDAETGYAVDALLKEGV